MSRVHRSLLPFACLLLLTGCQPRDGGRPADGVHNETLQLLVSTVPQPFVLEESTSEAIRFTVEGKPGEARLSVVPPPERGSVNLVEATKGRLAWFERQPEGESFGSQELVAPFGSAYTARGRYRRAGTDGRVEELWTLGFHRPSGGMLQLVYRYPAGEDSAERAQELLALIGEIGFGRKAQGLKGSEAQGGNGTTGAEPKTLSL